MQYYTQVIKKEDWKINTTYNTAYFELNIPNNSRNYVNSSFAFSKTHSDNESDITVSYNNSYNKNNLISTIWLANESTFYSGDIEFGLYKLSISIHKTKPTDVSEYIPSSIHLRISYSDENGILLLNNSGESNRLNKYPYISLYKKVIGTFRENISVIDPEFTVELEDYPNINYIYIYKFNRFYFIDDIVIVRNNLYQISCHCDVLMSFMDDILKQFVYVKRQQYEYDPYLPDIKLPVKITNIVETIYFSEEFFKEASNLTEKSFCYVITFTTTHEIIFSVPNNTLLGTNTYIVNLLALRKILKWVLTATWKNDFKLLFTNPSESLVSLKYFPFDIKEAHQKEYGMLPWFDDFQSTRILYLANLSLDIGETVAHYPDAWLMYYPTDLKLDFGDINLKGDYAQYKYLHYEPYFNGKLYLPFYGFCELPISTILGTDWRNSIHLEYHIDLINGDCIAKINDYLLIEFNIGCDLPLTSTNLNEVATKKLMLGIKVGGAVISKGVSLLSDYNSLELKNDRRYKTPHLTKSSQKKLDTFKKEAISDILSNAPNNIATITNEFISASQTSISGGVVQNMWISQFLEKKPYLIYKYPEIIEVAGYEHLVGRPSSYAGYLSELKGYTEVGGVHLENISNATSDELSEIDTLLRNGILCKDS